MSAELRVLTDQTIGSYTWLERSYYHRDDGSYPFNRMYDGEVVRTKIRFIVYNCEHPSEATKLRFHGVLDLFNCLRRYNSHRLELRP